LDILFRALWTTAAGIGARKKFMQPIDLRWLAPWSVLPDLIVFSVPAVVRIWRFLAGVSKTLLPDGNGPHFDWLWGLYNGTHSLLVFAVCFVAAWLLFRKPPLEMLGWALHMVIEFLRTAACSRSSFCGRFRRFTSMACGGKRLGFCQ
jgi:hypothetical protein